LAAELGRDRPAAGRGAIGCPAVQLTVAVPEPEPFVAVTTGAAGAPTTGPGMSPDGAELVLVPMALVAVTV